MQSQIDQILDPLLSIEALCYGALRTVTLSERVESGINDRTTESLIYFCGSDIKSLTSPKIETQISSSIQRIRNIEINELQYSMKYLAILLETLTYGKLLTAQDYLLITHAITSGILKILNERVEHSETVTEEKQSLEIKELQRKLDNSTSTSEETKRMASEVEKLSTELKESNNKLSLLQKDLASVSNELLSQKSLNVDLSEKLELEKQAVLNLENQLREYETQIEMKRTEQEESIQILHSKLNQLQIIVNEKAEWISPIELTQLMEKKDIEFNKIFDEMKQKENDLQHEIHEIKDTNRQLTKRVHEFESQVELNSIMQSSTAEQQERIKLLQQELQESRQDFSIVQNELIETQKELSSKQDWISPRNFNQEKEAWERTKILEISEFKKRLESAESQNNELQSEYTSLQEEFDRLVIDEEKNKDEMSRKLEESVILYEQSNAERELLKREVSKLKEESGEFRTEIAILQKQIDGYANWISPEIHQSSETSIASLKSQLLQQMEFIETLQKQIQEKDKVIHEIKAGSDEASERDDRLDLSLIQLEKFKNVIQSLKLINKSLEEKNEINEKIIHEKLQSIQILESQIQAFSSFPSNGNTPGKQQQIRFASNNSSVVNPTLTLNSPIIFFEIGSFTTRIGIWKENQFLQCFSCPTVIARPKNKNISASDLTRTASSYSSIMYTFFRENNILLGNDAWYCCFQHPDGGLRGSLSLSYPMTYSGIIEDRPGFLIFLEYCISSLEEQKIHITDDTQIILSYKSNYDMNDYRLFSDLFFDKHNLSVMCYLHESLLTSVGYHQNSSLVIDIGARVTTVTPIFESFIMKHCIKSTQVGGEHLTEFLELLIDAQGIDIYSSQLIRRRQEFSRFLKEKYAFVAPSFDQYIALYGRFTFDYLQVMSTPPPTTTAATTTSVDTEHRHGGLKYIQSSSCTEKTTEIQIKEIFQCNDGTCIDILIDRELFYCSEILFAPFLHETCQNEQSLIEVILSSVDSIDESVRSDICQTIILDGNTSNLKGLKERLELDLQSEMKKRGVSKFNILFTKVGGGNGQQSHRWHGADRFIQNLSSSPSSSSSSNSYDSLSIPSSNIITCHGYEIEGLGIFSNLS